MQLEAHQLSDCSRALQEFVDRIVREFIARIVQFDTHQRKSILEQDDLLRYSIISEPRFEQEVKRLMEELDAAGVIKRT